MLIAAAILAWGGGLSANGRFPTAQQLLEDPKDPRHLVLRATYGVLTTYDAGANWSLICEEAVDYQPNEDPVLGLMDNGNLIASTFKGLALSQDGGCSWQRAIGGGMEPLEIVDVTVEPGNRTNAFALVAQLIHAQQAYVHQIWASTDNGLTWRARGSPWGADRELVGFAFEAAPSDPRRIYISATQARGVGFELDGVLRRSDDGGVTWSTLPIAGTDSSHVPYLSAVSPSNPDVLYVRVQGSDDDVLLQSLDGGKSWQERLRGRAMMAGFALSPDGSQIAIGFGRPLLPRQKTVIDCSLLGVWIASTQDFLFSRVPGLNGSVHCLTWTNHGLYACTGHKDHGFALAVSGDAGNSFVPLMELDAVAGLQACPPTSAVASQCAEPWLRLCPIVGKPCAGQRLDPTTGVNDPNGTLSMCQGVVDAGPPPDAGPPAAGAGAQGPAASGTASPPPLPNAPSSGCGCQTSGTRASGHLLWALVLIGAVVQLLRRLGHSEQEPAGKR